MPVLAAPCQPFQPLYLGLDGQPQISFHNSTAQSSGVCAHPYENSALRWNQHAICSLTGQAPEEKFTLKPKARHTTLFLGVKRQISPSCLLANRN
jgi:hypothetical protein